jgi:zinc-ribbon domain
VVWAVTALVLLIGAAMMIRVALMVGTVRGAASAVLSISVTTAALVLVAQSAGLLQVMLPSLGPVLYFELVALLVPVGLASVVALLIMKSEGFRKFRSQEPHEKVAKPSALSYPMVVTLAFGSFLMLSLSIFMPWITAGSTPFSPSNLYMIILGEDTVSKRLWQQVLSQVHPAALLADSFVAIGLVLALLPISMLFSLLSMLPKRTTTILVVAILPIAASFLALYASMSTAWHIFGPASFSVSQIRLESGSSLATLSGGLLLLAHSVSSRTPVTGATRADVSQHETISGEEVKPQDIPLYAIQEKKKCPNCGAEVSLNSLICPECGMPAMYRT